MKVSLRTIKDIRSMQRQLKKALKSRQIASVATAARGGQSEQHLFAITALHAQVELLDWVLGKEVSNTNGYRTPLDFYLNLTDEEVHGDEDGNVTPINELFDRYGRAASNR